MSYRCSIFKFYNIVTGYIYHTWRLTRISFRKYFESIIKAHLFHICFCYYALYLDLAEKQVYHFKVRCYFFMSAYLGRNIFYLPFNSLLSQIRSNELFFSAIDINNSSKKRAEIFKDERRQEEKLQMHLCFQVSKVVILKLNKV